MKRLGSITPGIGMVAALLLLSVASSTNVASAHCKGKHANYEPHCGGTEPPPDPDPPANPALVYASATGGTVRVMDADGSNNVSVFDKHVSRNLWARNVRWSPSGEQIVYIERNNPPAGLYIANSDGSNRTDISPYDGDGTRIWVHSQGLEWREVYVSDGEGASGPLNRIFFLGSLEGDTSGHTAYWDVYTVDPESSNPVIAHNVSKFDHSVLAESVRTEGATVSPDGRRIALGQRPMGGSYSDQNLVIYETTVENGELELGLDYDKTPSETPNGEFSPSVMRWANTGDRLIYTENDLFVLDFAGTATLTQLTGGTTQVQLGCEQAATWSPDDDQLAFDVQCVNNQVEGIYVGDLAIEPTSQQLTLTNYQKILKSTASSHVDWRRTWTATQ